MANDKITMLKLKRMLQLLDAGRSMNQVCAELHMSKRTVHSYKERAEQSEIPLYVLPCSSLHRRFRSRTRERRNWTNAWTTSWPSSSAPT